MPFGLGFFAAAGGAAAAPAYTLIQTSILTSNQASITFSSIPQTYKHLQIRYTARNSGSSADFAMRINGLTSSYQSHWLFGNGSSVTSGARVDANRVQMPQGMTSSFTANLFASGIIDIADYASTNKLKTIRMFYGHTEFPRLYFASALQTGNTDAVTSITFLADSNNIAIGSRFSLYGLQ